jgi:nucleotide-binding universal stress UspA family protein
VVPAVDGAARGGLDLVLVALDGSAEAERGLVLARELASRANARVALVRAYTVPPAVGVEFAYYPPDLVTSLEEGAREYLADTAREGEQCVVALGSAPEIVAQAANELDADLVAMTSHGKGLAGRLALGSTTDRVMHTLRRPLLIVPAPRD